MAPLRALHRPHFGAPVRVAVHFVSGLLAYPLPRPMDLHHRTGRRRRAPRTKRLALTKTLPEGVAMCKSQDHEIPLRGLSKGTFVNVVGECPDRHEESNSWDFVGLDWDGASDGLHRGRPSSGIRLIRRDTGRPEPAVESTRKKWRPDTATGRPKCPLRLLWLRTKGHRIERKRDRSQA